MCAVPAGGDGNPPRYYCLENPWTEQPGGLQSTGSQRVRRNSATEQDHHTDPLQAESPENPRHPETGERSGGDGSGPLPSSRPSESPVRSVFCVLTRCLGAGGPFRMEAGQPGRPRHD